jgi:hypothetical protein
MTPHLNNSDTQHICGIAKNKELKHQEIPRWITSVVFYNTYLKFLQLSLGYSISLGNNWDDINFRI